MMVTASSSVSPAVGELDAPPQKSKAGDRQSRLFVHLAIIFCLCLQRFGLSFGDSSFLFFCLPLFLMLLGWMLASGYGQIRMAPLALFALFALDGLLVALIAINVPETRHQISILSLFSLFSIYLCLLVGPTEKFNKENTLDIFLFYIRAFSVLGIFQYLIQFVGVKIFSFMLTFPILSPILIEKFYNYNPILHYGSSIIRSNGFFLLEPSIFSQMLALGMAVEFFLKRQVRYLPLYVLAYIFSFSGTGLLALAISIAILALADRRYTGRVVMFIVALGALAAIVALALPDVFASLASRAGEGSQTGSSGYHRYFAQFDFISHYTGNLRSLIGFGPGGMQRSEYFFEGSANPALKLYIEYGIVGLVLFALFLGVAIWRRDISIVSVFFLVNFQMGGGNILFSPFIILMAVLCVWSAAPVDFRLQGRTAVMND